MTDVYRVTATWSGFSGAPGYSRFSFMNLTDAASINSAGAAIREFFNALSAYLRSDWAITIQPTVQIYDSSGGHLISEVTMATVPSPVIGTVSNITVYHGGVGARINWLTSLIFAGHRVRGRTYLVPLVGHGGSDGTLVTAALTAIQNAGNTLVAGQAGKFAVWSKTFNTAVPPVQIGGALASVTTVQVPDKTGILKSRRD